MTKTASGPRRLIPAASSPVFSNPSGRRWRLLRRTGVVVSLTLLATLIYGAPKLVTAPALGGATVPNGPTAAEIGHPPVIGEGPLVRIVKLLRTNGRANGAVYAQDPFTGQVEAQLQEQELAEAGDAAYAIQRYGYSAAVHKTISLTFDDGPDPVWTPRLLDLLSKYHVPATFFVTGEQMAKYPDIIARMTREGFAVGNHSLTHTDVNGGTAFREKLELALTDRILRAETGTYSSYFRLPYEGADTQETQDDLPGMLRAQQHGYVLASHDFDTLDWAIESGEREGPIPLPPFGQQDNITLLAHDAGGRDRSGTLQYIEKVIQAGRQAGYTFHTMPQVQPWIQERTGPTSVTVADKSTRWLAEVLFVLPNTLLFWLFVLALVTMLGIGVFNTLLALIRWKWGRRRITTATPPVSVLIAAYNEEAVIRRTLERVLASAYSPLGEVIVVDDGSTDETADVVRDVVALDPRVRLIQQPNGGKWSALNRGFAAARYGHVVTLDADTLFAPDTIRHLMARFHSPRVGAVAGVIKVGNYRRNIITRWQALEYVTQIGVDRAAAALLNAIMIVPGACAAWRREAVLEAGGYSPATLAEDCDLTLMLHQYGWRVEQADEALAYTEAPETADALLKQRIRWTFGTLQATWRHRNMLLRPRYGWLGVLIMPMAVATVVVPLVFTPFITWVLIDMVLSEGIVWMFLYLGLFAVIYGVLALAAVVLLREWPAHLAIVPLYRFIYEPLRAYLLYASVGTALRGIRLGWNKLDRTANMDEASLHYAGATS